MTININKEKGELTISCATKSDLLPNTILNTLFSMKNKLEYELPKDGIQRKHQCLMTPAVKKSLIQANKRAKRYGKDAPVIARFDEYGRVLPDSIQIDHIEGITVVIVDPKKVGEFYFALHTVKGKYDDLLSKYNYDEIMKDLPF